jgi:hydrogen peroxide-dependent heme synthase
MSESTPDVPVSPSIGLGVVHLFCKVGEHVDRAAAHAAVAAARAADHQVVTASILGHKADLCVMVLGNDWRVMRRLQTALQRSGLDVVDSYVSLTEVSEYAAGLPEEMLRPRLYPELPPEGKPAFAFYPMSKKRDGHANWFALPFEERKSLMHEHGISGRKFAGRVVQLITASTGLDAYEWGVTLFCVNPDDIKNVVYTMRFDTASAVFAEFGPFYVGMLTEFGELIDR